MSITASLMEGASGGSSLPLPSGHLDEPLLLESSAPWPSLSLSHSQPADQALLGPSCRTRAAMLQFRQLSAREPFCWAQQSSAITLGLVTWVCRSPTLWPALPSC